MGKEQIIKALECCSTPSGKRCENCPKVTEDALCIYRLSGDALALIKQQDEQKFQLENRLKECENGYAGTLHLESNKLHDAEERVKELTIELDAMRGAANSYKMHNERLTEDNETLTIKCNAWHLAAERVGEEIQVIKANTVREIFKEIYSSLDYIEEQMEPEEIPECFFSVREDINALKVRFEGEGNSQTFGEGE